MKNDRMAMDVGVLILGCVLGRPIRCQLYCGA